MEKNRKLITRYKNSFNSNLIFRTMNSAEQNLLFTLITMGRDKDTTTISYKDIRRITGNKTAKNYIELERFIINTFKQINSIEACNEKNLLIFSPFELLNIDRELQLVSFQFSSSYIHFFNDLRENFTEFDLCEHNALKSRYTKILYRVLKQFKSTGMVHMNREQLLNLFCEEDRDFKEITRNVIKNAVEELNSRKCFQNLKYEYVRDEREQGRPITRITFTFKKEIFIQQEKNKKVYGPKIEQVKYKQKKDENIERKRDYDFDELLRIAKVN